MLLDLLEKKGVGNEKEKSFEVGSELTLMIC